MTRTLSLQEMFLIDNASRLLKQMRISGTDAARVLGIAPSTFYLKMEGRRHFTITELDELSHLLLVDPHMLIHKMED